MDTLPMLLAQANAARRRVIAATDGLTPQQESFRVAPGEWSAPQILEHLALAESGGLASMWAEAQAVRQGRPTWTGPLTNHGQSFDEIVARTWRPRELAPPDATPAIDGPLAYTVAHLEACQPLLAALLAALHGLDPTQIICPHFLSGPLDVCQRLQFLRWHMDHHRVQLEELCSGLA